MSNKKLEKKTIGKAVYVPKGTKRKTKAKPKSTLKQKQKQTVNVKVNVKSGEGSGKSQGIPMMAPTVIQTPIPVSTPAPAPMPYDFLPIKDIIKNVIYEHESYNASPFYSLQDKKTNQNSIGESLNKSTTLDINPEPITPIDNPLFDSKSKEEKNNIAESLNKGYKSNIITLQNVGNNEEEDNEVKFNPYEGKSNVLGSTTSKKDFIGKFIETDKQNKELKLMGQEDISIKKNEEKLKKDEEKRLINLKEAELLAKEKLKQDEIKLNKENAKIYVRDFLENYNEPKITDTQRKELNKKFAILGLPILASDKNTDGIKEKIYKKFPSAREKVIEKGKEKDKEKKELELMAQEDISVKKSKKKSKKTKITV